MSSPLALADPSLRQLLSTWLAPFGLTAVVASGPALGSSQLLQGWDKAAARGRA